MRRFPFSSRAVLPALISLALPPGLVAQPSGSQEVLQLPTYTVTAERELPPPEAWLYTRIDGFEVLSNASESKSRDLLNEFQRFAHALNLVWPGMTPGTGAPAALVICGRGDKFEPFRPPAAASIDKAMVSLTLRSRDQAAIVLDLQTKVLNLATAESSTPAGAPTDEIAEETGGDPGLAVDAYRQLYREYVRFLLGGREAPSPVWFSEGLAQIFMAMKVTESSITLGKLADPNLVPPAPVGGLAWSARTGQGLDAVRHALLQQAGWQAAPEGLFIARTRHVQALRRTQHHLRLAQQHAAVRDAALDLLAEELRLAHRALGEITGVFSNEDLLGEIFSRFCIGK